MYLGLPSFLMRPSYDWDEDTVVSSATDIFRASAYSWIINFLGLPAAIAPAGLHNGLPIGVQLVGQRFREDLCLDAAEAVEREAGVQSLALWRREGWLAE